MWKLIGLVIVAFIFSFSVAGAAMVKPIFQAFIFMSLFFSLCVIAVIILKE